MCAAYIRATIIIIIIIIIIHIACLYQLLGDAMYKMHHPRADIDRLYVKRKGGRGLVQIEAAYKAEIMNIAEYLNTNYKKDQFVSRSKPREHSTKYELNN